MPTIAMMAANAPVAIHKGLLVRAGESFGLRSGWWRIAVPVLAGTAGDREEGAERLAVVGDGGRLG